MKTTLSISLLCITSLSAVLTYAQKSTSTPGTLHFTEKSKIHIAAQAPPPLSTIFSNLGPPTDTYNDEFAEVISGPTSTDGLNFSFALPFTPKANAHVREVRAAIEYGGTGANQVNLSIYSDAAGLPGSVLVGPGTVTDLPNSQTCCTLAVWKLTTELAVTAGTRYWIVANTPTTGVGSDFFGVWNVIYPTPYLQASNFDGFSWETLHGGQQEVAAAVYGTIP